MPCVSLFIYLFIYHIYNDNCGLKVTSLKSLLYLLNILHGLNGDKFYFNLIEEYLSKLFLNFA